MNNNPQHKQIVISNHTDLFTEWIHITKEHGYTKDNIIIYDRKSEDSSRIEKYGTVIKSPNVGENIYDIGRHVYENYESLADFTIFLKCNLLQRTYTSEQKFRYALDAKWLVPIDTSTEGGTGRYPNFNFYPSKIYVNQSTMVEDFKECSVFRHGGKNFETLLDLMNDLFIINHFPDYISFNPAANYVIPKDVLRKYSKNFYKKMMDYTNYSERPVEAHMFERCLEWAFSGSLIEKTCSV